jgi:hypothetical protein
MTTISFPENSIRNFNWAPQNSTYIIPALFTATFAIGGLLMSISGAALHNSHTYNFIPLIAVGLFLAALCCSLSLLFWKFIRQDASREHLIN